MSTTEIFVFGSKRPNGNKAAQPNLVPLHVLVEESIETTGFDPRWLKPSSCRPVVARCVECGETRVKGFRSAASQPTCLRCSNRKNGKGSAEFHSKRMTEYYANGGKHHLVGVGHSAETKTKMSVSFTGRKPNLSDEARKRLASHCMSILNNPERSELTAALNRKRTGPLSHSFGKPPAHAKKVWHDCVDGSRVCFRSTWEAAYARMLDRNGIKWEYECITFPVKYELSGDLVDGTYTPDFKTDHGFIEVKGRWIVEARAKFEAFVSQYQELKIQLVERTDMFALGLINAAGKVRK